MSEESSVKSGQGAPPAQVVKEREEQAARYKENPMEKAARGPIPVHHSTPHAGKGRR